MSAKVKLRAEPERRNRVKFSASQVDTFRSCPRKWFLQYVCGAKTPPSPSQAVGTAIHAEIEGYLVDGKWPNADPSALVCAQASTKNLPKPGPDLLVEHEFNVPLGSKAPGGEDQTMGGFIDLAHGRALGEGKLVIRDHKTTKDYVWNKTEAELRHNTQGVTYAFVGYSMPKLPREGALLLPVWDPLFEDGVDLVEFGHHYVKTQKPLGSTVVAAEMPWEKVAVEWARIKGDVEAMTELAATGSDDPIAVPGNRDSCDAYGGCFFGCGRRGIGLCQDMVGMDLMKKVRSEQEEKEMEKKAMNIRERLAARKAAQTGGTAPAAAPAPDTTPKAPESPPAATSTPPAAESPAPVAKAPEAPPAQAEGVVPPDAPNREQTPEEAAALAPPEKVKKRAAQKKAGKTVGAAAQAAAPTGEDIAAAQAAIDEKAEEVKVKLDELPAGQVPTASAPFAGAKFAKVDCLPIDAELARSVYGGDFVPAERWLDPIKRAVAQEFGETDYALIEFGKGKAALAAAIKATADTLPRLIYVSSFSRSADVLVDELIAQGYVVEKAVRG